MKKLTRITLIHWFRFKAVDVPIAGNTAVVGKSGSGKSALLDAIQTVMTGGNKNHLKLNRASNKHSTRTLKEYVLGVMHDPDRPDVKIKPREKTNCYLTLTFYDDIKLETTCVGMGIYASIADPSEKIEGYFICPGLVGSKELFLDTAEGVQQIVLPWVRVKDRLAAKCPATRFYGSEAPGKFTAELHTALSENAGSPNNDKVVLRAFLAALSMEQIENTTDFIRKFMLEPDNLQIKELQSALKYYREMRDKAESVAHRVDELKRIETLCEKVEQAHAKKIMSEYIGVRAKLEELEESAEPLRSLLTDLEEEREAVAQSISVLTETIENLSLELGARENEKQNSGLQLRRDRLQMQIDEQARIEEATRGDLSYLRRMIDTLGGLSSSIMPSSLQACVEAILEETPGAEDLVDISTWPANPSKLDKLLVDLLSEIHKALPDLKNQHISALMKVEEIGTRERELVPRLKQLQQGKAPIHPHTEGLIKYLKDYGVDAKPICDLVDVSDEKWRQTIESFLGNIREALVVIPEHAEKAIKLYRQEGRRKFPGRHIINTTQTDQWRNKSSKGALAELITTDNAHARAFMNRRMGNVMRVETEKELLQHDRAATADGMLASGGTITEMKSEPPILGRKSRDLMKSAYETELRELSTTKNTISRQAKTYENVQEELSLFSKSRANGRSVADLASSRNSSHKLVKEYRAELAAIESDERETQLDAEIQRLSGEIKTAKGANTIKNTRALQIEKDHTQAENTLASIETNIETFRAILITHKANPQLDKSAAADLHDAWRDQCATPQAICAKADETAAASQRVIDYNNRAIDREYTEYHLRNSYEEGDTTRPTEYEEIAATVRRKKEHLVSTTLAEYKNKTAKALVEAEDTFRAKFIGRLVGKLDSVRTQIDMLNRALEMQPFNEETYKFKSHPSPEFKHIIDFAKSFGNQPPDAVGGLFDPATDPDSPHQKALQDITYALQDPKAAERLQDYRNFLTFEVEIYDSDGAPLANLDYRIRKGSGGENQQPFYIAIGASLAAAYRLKKELFGTVTKGGINLAVFDEAFSKLSVEPCLNIIHFLSGINLQLIMAAPDDKFPLMAETMDEVIFITREDGNVQIDEIFIKEEMRQFLRLNNAFLKATGIKRDLLLKSAQVGEPSIIFETSVGEVAA